MEAERKCWFSIAKQKSRAHDACEGRFSFFVVIKLCLSDLTDVSNFAYISILTLLSGSLLWLLLLGAKTSGNCPQKTEIHLDYEEIFAYFLQKFIFFNYKARPSDKWNAQVLQHCVLYVHMWPFSPFVRASHPQPSLCVSYREACAAIVCMDAAATHYLGSRSLGSWRGERHPTPPRPFPQPATLFCTPCRGRTWSSRRRLASRVDSLLRHGHNVSKKERTRKKEISVFGSVNQIEYIKKCCFRLIYCWQWQLLYLRISLLFFFKLWNKNWTFVQLLDS